MLKKGIFIMFIFFMISCNDDSNSQESNAGLNLKFNAYDNATNNDAIIGLEWALAQIGATKIDGVFNESDQFEIDYLKMGFDNNAQNQLKKLHDKIKQSQAYKVNNSIDLGRYVALIIGASEHYYKITGIPQNIDDILSNYTFETSKGYIDNSLVSTKHRIISYTIQSGFKQLFLTSEIEPDTQQVLEYETLEIMNNGHLKYGIFDANGNRKNNGTSTVSSAGKPAKCMWCHESKISRLFSIQGNVNGFLNYLDFKEILKTSYQNLNQKQLSLNEGVDFSKTQDHVKMELLYISFMEPSALVLSKEWNLSISEVQNRLINLQTHQHEEFGFLGELYHRNEVEQFASFTSLEVSTSVREESQTEVNHID